MLKEAGEFLAFIFGNLFKGIWFLIRKAGFWVPLAFTALFFIIIAITRTPFASLRGIFIAGLIVTAVIGVALGIATNAKKLIGKKLPEKTREGITRVTVPDDAEKATPQRIMTTNPRPSRAKKRCSPHPRITRTKPNNRKFTVPAEPTTFSFTSIRTGWTITVSAAIVAKKSIRNINPPTVPFLPATFFGK